MKSFNSAFDTTQYTPKWAGFVWFQGEFDAYEIGYSNAYKQNLTNLINDIRAVTEVEDLPVIIPMIDVQNQWTYNSIVRAADDSVSQKMDNVNTVETKGLPTDGTHYKAVGYITIGQRIAQSYSQWISSEDPVHVLNPYNQKVNRVDYQTLSKYRVMHSTFRRMISSSGSKNIQNI